MKSILIPVVSEYLKDIPIAKIEILCPSYDLRIENILFNGAELIPSHIHLKMKSDYDVNINKLSSEETKSHFKLKIENISFHAENMKYWYSRKEGIRLEDHGIASVSTKNAIIKVYWKIKSKENTKLKLSLTKAYCKLGGMKIKIIQAKHNILDKITLALFAGHIKKNVERTVANNIITMLQPLEKKFNDIFKEESLSKEKLDQTTYPISEKREIVSPVTGDAKKSLKIQHTTQPSKTVVGVESM